ncbi:MAG: hypothetical protein LKH74_09870 [Levilactobacillus sp.]|jgi:hypothetical protein|uniref:hypothetical protein n=1 Tax=Levilactobacillus sp. TaxID=2767919 RepID=UPI00258A4291|nr:hypothetical protein [Levilactobacillus sp.]MCH4123951.1 hypothetical protein [Levilactobacillus sp.]MCI1554213.1 hypothetical protein [Levilactobacillus sp.]MCI1598797.1 hypothetical protein [Levilactobacillus sp.]MCI1605432.1 hypothetical protein [Levilactobacillus sp.]
MKRGILAAVTTLAVAGLGLWSSVPGYAAESVYYNYDDALKGAPQGVDLSSDDYKDYFWNGDNGVATVGGNMAKVVEAGSPSGDKNSAIQISKASRQNSWGAIWSKKTVFDLTKPETASMWIYASTEQQYLKDWGIGDGMAFVLQNSKDGVNAFSKATTLDEGKNDVVTPGVGESMGVWGMDPEDWNKTQLSDNAIDHSWALEFDTFGNDFNPASFSSQWDLNDRAPSSFDLGKYYNSFDDSSGNPNTDIGGTIPSGENHIASNYPGSPSTYTSDNWSGIKTNIWGKTALGGSIWYYPQRIIPNYLAQYYYYKMTHLGYLDEGKNADATTDKMTDHRWHHVTLTYTPPTNGGSIGKMKYVYDDKNSDTGQPKEPANEATVPLKLDEFKQDEQDNWDHKVRWGFTGSTGKNTENNLVVFDQVPGDVENNATATLSTQNVDSDDFTAVDTSSTPTIPGGTAVKLDYTFSRSGGIQPWKDINASLTIPKSITLTSGTLTTPDDKTSKVDISKRDGTTLPVALGSDDKGYTIADQSTGHITLYGTIDYLGDATSDVSEDAAVSYFNGSNASAQAELPAFNVKASSLTMTIAPEESTLGVDYNVSGQSAQIVGQAKFPYGTAAGAAAMTSDDITIHLEVNGTRESKPLTTILVNPSLDPWVFIYPVDNSLLKEGPNKVSLYSTSKSGERSNIDSTTVTAGSVGFGDISEDLVFTPTVLSGATTTIERSNDWSFYIDDSRKSGDWYLSAKTTGMTLKTAADTRLDGDLIYVDSNNQTQVLNDDNATLIDSGSANNGEDKQTNIAADWKPDQGILLRVNGSAMQGDYTGVIHWYLSNTP